VHSNPSLPPRAASTVQGNFSFPKSNAKIPKRVFLCHRYNYFPCLTENGESFFTFRFFAVLFVFPSPQLDDLAFEPSFTFFLPFSCIVVCYPILMVTDVTPKPSPLSPKNSPLSDLVSKKAFSPGTPSLTLGGFRSLCGPLDFYCSERNSRTFVCSVFPAFPVFLDLPPPSKPLYFPPQIEVLCTSFGARRHSPPS